MKNLSIIIPIYHNEKNLPITFQVLKDKVLKNLSEYEIIFVDDGSKDASYEVMQKLKKQNNNIKLIKLSRNFGSHAAIFAGLEHATGNCAAVISADLQDDPNIILQMYKKWVEGNQVVLAVRKNREGSWFQKFLSNTYYKIFQKIAISHMPKNGFDCFLIDQKVISVLSQIEEKNSTIMGQILWCGFKRDIIYYVRKAREVGKSRWTTSKKIKLFIDSILSFSYFPIRAVSVFGLIVFMLSFSYSIFLIIRKFIGGTSIQGWTTLVVLQLLVFGVQMLVLGLIGEYLWRTLDASRKRPVYVIEIIEE
ncbi:MAG TPA: glycosyltransferase family 2 protein [Burkholderiales bacterium]|nr:glycosyltransferase family 2 protein [Burkholderiales bacterium]